MTMQTVSNQRGKYHSFSEVPGVQIPRSTFNRSHGLKTTFDADYLIPIFLDDVIPGDTLNLNVNFFARLATPLHPIMDNMYLETFFFFVPYRLIWDNWEIMHGEQANPSSSIDKTVPVMSGTTPIALGSPLEYMGVPLGLVPNTTSISALPNRAYRLIYNEWFRDENLQNSATVITTDGPDLDSSYHSSTPLKRGKRHDYFTSCLPNPQKGATAVSLPLGGLAPIEGIGVDSGYTAAAAQSDMRETDATSDVTYSFPVKHGGVDPDDTFIEMSAASGGTPKIYANLDNASGAVDINEVRLAFQTQRLLERDARAGTRYVEHLRAHYGITDYPDARLQRPEFLGGGSSTINQNPVPQTSRPGTPATDDQVGDLGAFGTVSGRHGFTKSFVEHGLILGIANVRGDLTYSQGLDRYWSKSTRYDFYYPVLAQIGEQAVLNKEIFHNAAGTDNDDVFGYQERYAEYRYKPSRLSGKMRVDASGSLSAWHLSEDFGSLPTLSSTFIQSNLGVPLDRAITVTTEPHFIADFWFEMKHARPMPLYGVPGNLDHF